MTGDPIPGDVRTLLRQHIESYEQLQILLLMARAPDRAWSSSVLCSSLNVPSQLIDLALESLAKRQLLELRSGSAHEFVIAAADPAQIAAIQGLAQVYEQMPVEVIKLMSANAIERLRSGALRAFAEAFVIGKGGKDGKHG